jgi:hypothetical protein
MMFNSGMIKEATSDARGGLIDRLVRNEKLSDTAKIDYLFKAGLARKPSRTEMQVARALFEARGDNLTEALRDVWWVVLNSNEFIFNH